MSESLGRRQTGTWVGYPCCQLFQTFRHALEFPCQLCWHFRCCLSECEARYCSRDLQLACKLAHCFYVRPCSLNSCRSGSLSLLCELVQAEAHHFNHKVTSAALYRLSILCHAYFTQLQSAQLTSQEAQQAAWATYVDPALKTLGQLLLQHMDSCDAFTVSISMWAYGHLQYGEEAVLAALSSRGMQLLHEFNSIDCAAALVGLAKHTGPRTRSQREFVEQLMHHTHALLSHVDEWAPRDIISIVWALSQLGAAGPARRPLLQGLIEMSSWRLHEFGVRELVITAYSLGRLRMRLPPQMVKLTNQIMKRLDELNPQDAANLVYACAKVQFKQPELLQKLPDIVLPQLNSFKPQVS